VRYGDLKKENVRFLRHAFYEVVYSLATIACFATCTEILLRRPLKALPRGVQLENGLNPRQFRVVQFAFCDGAREVSHRFASDRLRVFFGEFLVACQPPTLRQQFSDGFFGDFAPRDVALHAFQHAQHGSVVWDEDAVVCVRQLEQDEGFSCFTLGAHGSANLHDSKAFAFFNFLSHVTSPSPLW
jgi:hypothetical protein